MDKLQVVLDALHRGAHQVDPRRPEDLDDEAMSQLAECANDVGHMAILRIRELLHKGRDLDAAHLCLDALQFARDLLDHGGVWHVFGMKLANTVISNLFVRGIDEDEQYVELMGKKMPATVLADLSVEAVEAMRLGLRRLERPLVPLCHVALARSVYFAKGFSAPVAGAEDVLSAHATTPYSEALE